MNPILSIIIPIYNRKEYFDRCLSSFEFLLMDDRIQFIFIDDGSEEVIEYPHGKKFIYKKLDKNYGPGKARNEGLKLVKGKFITFVDSDDCIKSSELGILIDKLEKEPDEYVYSTSPIIKDTITGEEQEIVDSWLYNVVWSKFYPSNLVKKYNMTFPEDISYGEDKAWQLTCEFAFLHRYLGTNFYTYYTNNYSLSDRDNSEGQLELGVYKAYQHSFLQSAFIEPLNPRLYDKLRYFTLNKSVACVLEYLFAYCKYKNESFRTEMGDFLYFLSKHAVSNPVNVLVNAINDNPHAYNEIKLRYPGIEPDISVERFLRGQV